MKGLLWLTLLIFVILVIFAYIINTNVFDSQPTLPAPPKDALYLDSSQTIEARAADLMSYMTLEEKIGQMTLVEKNSLIQDSDISNYYLGALLSGAGAKPVKNTVGGWQQMIAGYQTSAASTRLSIPLLYGSDGIHGHAHVPGATIFPHAIGLGATRNAELVRQIAYATAYELQVTGVNWNFAPNLDQPSDIRWGRVYEGFSDDPTVVSELGVATIQGLQAGINNEAMDVAVLATAKHFVGLGNMEWGSSHNKNYRIDQGVTPADDEVLRSRYLPPFKAAVDAGLLSVMVGLNNWGDGKVVVNKYLLTEVLKGELAFAGFVVSDWYGVHEGRRNTFLATVEAVNAGVDMVMLPFDYKTFVRHMKWANRLGLISNERIDDAVRRILYAKFALGLFNETTIDLTSIEIGGSDHRSLAREAVAQSAVLLQNNDAVIPLSDTVSRIRVVGSSADNIGMQSGAWTIEWQGVSGNEVPGGTSILTALRNRVGPGVEIEYNEFGDFAASTDVADIGIAIVGEAPYAEGWGDRELPVLTVTDLTAINKLQSVSKKIIVLLVSGRPLLITEEIADWDAVVAVWLPGSEGSGVIDVLFGDTPFVGTLPLPWPRESQQLPISVSGETKNTTEPLFPRNFGLSN